MAPAVMRFRTVWGVESGPNFEAWAKWFPYLKAQGYAGIELEIVSIDDLVTVRQLCEASGLQIIAFIRTHDSPPCGPRNTKLGIKDHLGRYRAELQRAKVLNPLKINSHSGSDLWSLQDSAAFFQATLAIDAELGLAGHVSHETHRNWSLFNLASTAYIVKQVPGLLITADFSHFVVVAERLFNVNEEDETLLASILPRVRHIHTRIGTTQSSQCPDPTNPVFTEEREFFESLWQQAITAQLQVKPSAPITFDPEYGPYPYHAFNAARKFGEVADTEGARLQKLFEAHIGELGIKGKK